MEITKEIKAKVLASYLGQQVINSAGTKFTMHGVRLSGTVYVGEGMEYCTIYKLILKPLTKLSDEDAKEIAMLIGGNHLHIITCFRGQPEFEKKPDERMIKAFISQSAVYEFLQYKGYDLPQRLLQGKTLEQAGIAIYE